MTLTDGYQRGSALSRSFLPLALISLGVVFLLGNLIPERSRASLVVLGLGVAFIIGRLTTGRYGYAVPAGLLIAIGAYLGLTDLHMLPSSSGPSYFFVVLGLGFGLVYLLGGRPAAVWPMVPSVLLVALGLIVLGVSSLGRLAGLSWIVAYWPAALVLIGVWLVFRDDLPASVRRPLASLGGLALLVYGVIAALATVAAGGAFARASFAPSFGSPPLSDSLNLEAPIAAGQTFTVNNSSGRTTIRATDGPNVHVTVTRHFALGGRAPEVRLAPDGDGVVLDPTSANNHWFFGPTGGLDYAIEVPTTVHVRARSSRGAIEVDGLGGEVSLSTSSGAIRGSNLRHLREASASSGSIALSGVFTEAAHVRASSGSVDLRLLPGSSVRLDVRTSSGSIAPHELVLSSGTTRPHALTGSLGSPAADAVLSVETASGSVQLSQ